MHSKYSHTHTFPGRVCVFLSTQELHHLSADSCYQFCMVITLSFITETHTHTPSVWARQASLLTPATGSAWWLHSPQWAACQLSARWHAAHSSRSLIKWKICSSDLSAHTHTHTLLHTTRTKHRGEATHSLNLPCVLCPACMTLSWGIGIMWVMMGRTVMASCVQAIWELKTSISSVTDCDWVYIKCSAAGQKKSTFTALNEVTLWLMDFRW